MHRPAYRRIPTPTSLLALLLAFGLPVASSAQTDATGERAEAGSTPADDSEAAPGARNEVEAVDVETAPDGDRTSGFVEPAIVLIDEDPHDSAKFEQYRDVPDGLTLPRLNLYWEGSDELFGGAHWLELDAVDAVQDDQRLLLGFGQWGTWEGTLGWTENPVRFGDGTRQLHTYEGDGLFTLSDTLQSAMQAAPNAADADMDLVWDPGTKGAILRDAIAASAEDIDVGYRRRTGFARFEFTPTNHWRFGVDVQRERRSGTKPQPLGMIFNLAPAEVAAPVDYTTDDVNLFAEYRNERFVLGGGFLHSDFSIGQDALAWDNQLALMDTAVNADTAVPGRSQLSLGTDNEMSQWRGYAGINLPGHTRINLTASHSRTTQDDDFLPFTINSLLPTAPLPASGADAEYENSLLDLRISSRPTEKLRIKGWYRDYEQDNQTPMLVFEPYAETDYTLAERRANLPFSYGRSNLGALIGFAPADWVELALSYDNEDVDRDHAGVEDSSEDTWKLTADFDVSTHLFLRFTVLTQEREADSYHEHYFEESFPDGEANVAPFNPGMRRFYWTDRERDKVSLMVDVPFNDKFGVYAEALRSDSEYFDPETGLKVGETHSIMEDRDMDGTPEPYDILLAGRTDSEDRAYTLGLSFTPTPEWRIFVDHTWERQDWRMASRFRTISGGIGTDNPLDDWFSDVEDRYRTFTLGFQGDMADGRWSLRGDLTVTEANGEIHTSFVPGGNASSDTTLTEMPELDNDMAIATLRLERHLPGGWDVGFEYWFEKWTFEDWQSDFNEAYMGNPTQDRGTANWIQLGLDFDDYRNHVIQVFARYRF